MNQPPGELQKLLQHIDQLIEQAADADSRAELERLKARLNTPEMLDMARDLAGRRRARPEDLVLEFHDPLLPPVLTAAGCVIATAVCLFAVVDGFKTSNRAQIVSTKDRIEHSAIAEVGILQTCICEIRSSKVRTPKVSLPKGCI